jgi:hypothetical protein
MRIWNKFLLGVFVICWVFIGFVSSIDAGLTVAFQDTLKYEEQNPVARLILAEDGWKCGRFIGMKMFGTILVLGVLMWLYHICHKHALLVSITLAVFQGLLLLYLLVI